MRPETQYKLDAIIENNVACGFQRGQQLFAESLEEDLQKSDVLQQIQLEGVIDYLVSDYINRNSR